METLEFSKQPSPHKHETTSAKEWLDVLKLHWKLSETTMTENESDILVMKFNKNYNTCCGYYSKETKQGVVYTTGGK